MPITFIQKRDQALALLAQTGIWRSNYAPPALQLLWVMGLQVPPPHFAPFAATALIGGGLFGVVWGGLMWLSTWGPGHVAVPIAVLSAAIAGALFGLFMALYYAYGRRKYKLPRWDALGATDRP